MMIDRRSFLTAVTALPLGLGAIAKAQIVERGRFGDDDLPLIRDQLLQLVNRERLAAGESQLELDELANQVGEGHALDMAKGRFISHWVATGVSLISATHLRAESMLCKRMSRRQII